MTTLPVVYPFNLEGGNNKKYSGNLFNADIELGATVELAKMPVSAQNGKFKVIGCHHTIHKNTGFLTQLTIMGL